jgi:hypothetical protein
LLEVEHVVVKKLLEPLVGVIDAKLLERVELENFETGDIEDSDEVLGCDVQSFIDSVYDPQEETTVQGTAEGVTRLRGKEGRLVDLHSLVTHETEGSADGSGELGWRDLEELSGLVNASHVGDLGAVVTLEGNVTQVQDGSDDGEDEVLLFGGEAERGQGGQGSLEFALLVDGVDGGRGVVRNVLVVGGVGQAEGVLTREALDELVEDVEVTFALSLVSHTRPLEQVGDDGGTRDLCGFSESDLNEFTESRRVIVLGGLGVTEGFEKRIGLDQLLFELSVGTVGGQVTGNGGQVLDDLLGVFGLTSTGLTTEAKLAKGPEVTLTLQA